MGPCRVSASGLLLITFWPGAVPTLASPAHRTFAPTGRSRRLSLSPVPAAPSPVGLWEGKLLISAIEIRLVFHVGKTPKNSFAATLDSPDQGAFGIPAGQTTLTHGQFRMEAPAIGGVYEGRLQRDGATMVGSWQQGGMAFPLTLRRVSAATVLHRPQEPQPPFPYESRDVVFDDRDAGVHLAGTLTLPRSPGPFPAVLLIAGSGPNTRDEPIMGHRPFLLLADRLTRRGVAVLRYDKRGVGHSTGRYATATTADYANDAQAAVEYLKGLPEIDAHKIGLLGHSEGGVVAPMVAARSADVAFVVMLAGSGVPGSDILLKQEELIGSALGMKPTTLQAVRRANSQVFRAVEEEKDPARLHTRVAAIWREEWHNLPPAARQRAGQSAAIVDAELKQLGGAWFRYFLRYDPGPTLGRVKCPVLALNGSRDLQVPPDQNLPAIRAALKAAGNADATVLEIPGLNHLFQDCKTGSPLEYGRIEETMSPATLKLIVDWITAHTGAAR